jgi:diaminopropionate ammonia-lyase
MSKSQDRAVVPPTTLLDLDEIARRCGVGRVLLKAENERALGNFKSLGGTRAVEQILSRGGWWENGEARLLCASDGNHGLAVAAAARRSGVRARVYLPAGVERTRIERIEREKAEVILVSGSYDAAVAAAKAASRAGQGRLVADTSDDADDLTVLAVMSGYLVIAEEIAEQLAAGNLPRPTQMFIQAGVGGFAAAMARGLRANRANGARVIIVEPERAACVGAALAAGQVVQMDGDLRTSAEMLSCGRASAPALSVLREVSAQSLLISEDELTAAPGILKQVGLATTPSGAAGLAGLLKASADPELRHFFGLDEEATVLIFATEAAAGRDGPCN